MLAISELAASGESYSLNKRSRSKFYTNASTIINKREENTYAESYILKFSIEGLITSGENLNYKKLINKGYKIPGLDPKEEKLIKMMPTWGIYNFCKGFMEFIDALGKFFRLKMDPAPKGARLALNKFTRNKDTEIDPNEVLRARQFLIGNKFLGNKIRPLDEMFWSYLPVLLVIPLALMLHDMNSVIIVGASSMMNIICDAIMFKIIERHLKNPLYVNKIFKFLDKHKRAIDDLIRQAEAKGDKGMIKKLQKERTRTDKNRERVEKIFATRKNANKEGE